MNILRNKSKLRDANPRKKTPERCEALVIILLMWFLNDNLLSTRTPRSHTHDDSVSSTPPIKYFRRQEDKDLFDMDKTLHLLIFILNCQVVDHKTS